MIRRQLIPVLFTLVAVSVSLATSLSKVSAADPAGTYRWTHDEGGETVKNALVINYDGKLVTGVYKGRIEKSIEAAKLDGDKLTFKFDAEYQGIKMEVKFDASVKSDELDGKVLITADGQTQEYPWTAKRSLESEDVLGTWSIKITTSEGRTVEPEIKVTKDGSNLKGTYRTKGIEKDFEARDLKVSDQQLSFTVAGQANDTQFTVKYTGRPRGDKMSGKVDYDLNGNTGSIDFEATRPATKPAEAKATDSKSK